VRDLIKIFLFECVLLCFPIGGIFGIDQDSTTISVPPRSNNELGGPFVPHLLARNLKMTDSILSWNTFLGDHYEYEKWAIAVDLNGNSIATGSKTSGGVFVAKLNASGVVQWYTFLGGLGYAIATDKNGNIYVAGTSYHTWGTPIRPFNPTSHMNAFVAKLSPSGVLQWNTFLGGSDLDYGYGLALDANGNMYVAGWSYESWGTPLRPHDPGWDDAFVAKLDNSGVLLWNTFLGGSGGDYAFSVAVDSSGNIGVAGHSSKAWTSSINVAESTTGTFASKLDSEGVLQWTFFFDTPSSSQREAIAADSKGNFYLVSSKYNTWGSPINPFSGGNDAFVAKLNASGVLQWNTFIGGAGSDHGNAVAVDANGKIYIAGDSKETWGSPALPFTGTGFTDGYIAALNENGVLQWHAFLGGADNDICSGVASDSSGSIYASGDSMATWGSPIRSFFSRHDPFVAKISMAGIILPSISVTSPNGGESWHAGSTHNITWSTSGDVGPVKIEYSLDGGSNWNTIVGSTVNSGSYAWTVPILPSTNCRVRISQVAGGIPSDVSDAAFSILFVIPTIQLSRTYLNFGSVAGNFTSGQTIIIGNSGSGTLNWAAASNQTWLGVTPASGTGTGIIQVSVNPAGLAAGLTAGTYTGTITVSDPNASNSPRTINVGLTVKAAGALPFGDFATPLNGTTGITGAIPVTGWVLDDVEVTQVRIWRDPASGEDGSQIFIGDAVFVEGARPDVESTYSTYPFNYRAGWGYMLLTNFLPAQGNGTFNLYAYATDKEGNKVLLGTKTIACDNAHAVKPFGTIDTPTQGGNASGNPFLNFGWVLTPMPKTVPKDGSTIDVFVDSVKVGNLATAPNVYNQYRVDVASSFPGLNNSSGPVGAFFLDTTKLTNGVHTIFWIATDDAGQADGIGSRYFNVVNTGGAAASSRHREERSDAAIPTMESLSNLPLSFDSLNIKRGFNLAAPAERLDPDNLDFLHIETREVERIELNLGKGSSYRGYLQVGDELRPLPIGSTLNQRTGLFSWLPGPGFLGTYEMVFLKEDGFGVTKRIPIRVTIKPKFMK